MYVWKIIWFDFQLQFIILFYTLLTLVFYTNMWQFLKRRCAIKEGDFSPRHMDNCDEVSDLEPQASDECFILLLSEYVT
jgi:hypothetical protein